jgi:hypothetical protein
MMKPHFLLRALVLATLATATIPAAAIDDSSRAAARELVSEGVTLYKANRYDEARTKFLQAYEFAKVPTVGVWAGQAYEKLGNWVTAVEFYEGALLMQSNDLWVGNAQQQAQQQAQELLAALKPLIPTVQVLIAGSDTSEVEVAIDGVKIPNATLALMRPLNPGSHVFTATRGGKVNNQTVELVQGQRRNVTVTAPAPTPVSPSQPPSTTGAPKTPDDHALTTGQAQRTAGWVSLGVGTAGLVAGTAAGAIVWLKRSSLHDDGCAGDLCSGAAFSSRVDSYNSWRTLSSAALAVGAIGVGAGVTLLLTSPRQDPAPQLGVTIAPGGFGLKGAF